MKTMNLNDIFACGCPVGAIRPDIAEIIYCTADCCIGTDSDLIGYFLSDQGRRRRIAEGWPPATIEQTSGVMVILDQHTRSIVNVLTCDQNYISS